MKQFSGFFDISGRKFLVILFFLFFLFFFRLQPIPLNADDFGYLWIYQEVSHFSSYTWQFFFDVNMLSRPLSTLYYMPVIFLFNSSDYLLLLSMHFMSVLAILLFLYLNFKVFSRKFGIQPGLLSTFLLGTTYTISYIIGYVGSMNITIVAVLWLAILYFIDSIDSKKGLFAVFLLTILSIFTREAAAPPLFLMFLLLLGIDLLKFFLKKGGLGAIALVRKHFVLFLPFLLLWLYLNILFGGLGQFQAGLVQSDYSKALEGFLAPGQGLDYYATYFSYYLLAPIFILAIIAFVAAFFWKKFQKRGPEKKKSAQQKNSLSALLHWLEKNSFSLLLLASFLGNLVPLAMNTHSAYRYLIPLFPIIFVFFSKLLADSFLAKLNRLESAFLCLVLALNLVFAFLFFNATTISALLGLETATMLLNLLFFTVLLVAAIPLVLQIRNINRIAPSFLFALLLFLVSFSVLVQLNEAYAGFFVVHYSNSETAFNANKFIAATLPSNSKLFITQGLSWIWAGSLGGFRRSDISLQNRVPANEELKKGIFLVSNGIEGNTEMLDLVNSDPERYRLLATFGGGYRKHLRSQLDKSMFFSKLRLFEFFPDRNPEIRIYEFTG